MDATVIDVLEKALEERARREKHRKRKLAAVGRESERALRDMIRRWQALPPGKRTNFLRKRVLSGDDGHRKLDLAARLGIQSVPNRSLWQPALTRALESGAAVYDTLFVELAAQRQLPLAAFDRHILKKFPNIAKRPVSLS